MTSKTVALGQVELRQRATLPRGRDVKLQQLGRQTLAALYMLVRNVKLYDPDNEVFEKPLEDLRQAIDTIVAIDGAFQLQAVGSAVYVNGAQLRLDFASIDNVRALTEEMKSRDVGGFSVQRRVQPNELRDFIWLFSPRNDRPVEEDGVEGRRLTSIRLGRFARIREQLDKMEDAAIEAERQVDRKRYALTVYARTITYMRRFIAKLQSGERLPSMAPAQRLVQDFVDIAAENRAHFLGMTTARATDEYLPFHAVNTCLLSIVFGQELGLTRAQCHELGMAALFHDIGMAEIDPAILNKADALSREERRAVDLFPLHTVKTLLKGRSLDRPMTKRILAAYESKVDWSVPMKDAEGNVRIVRPKIELGIYGSIIHITALYDALTSARPFREAYGPEVALTLMTSEMQHSLDPFLVRIFMKVMAIQPIKILGPGERSIRFEG